MAKFMVEFHTDRSQRYLEEIVEIAREEGKIPRELEATTAYTDAMESKERLTYLTHIGLHPLIQESREAFPNHPELFESPLSTITNIYAGKKPELYLVQKRNKKGVNQGQLAIMPASAGFIIYGSSAKKTAIKETNEETGLTEIDLIDISSDIYLDDTDLLKSDGIVMHYLGPKRIRNPCFVYTFRTDCQTESKQDGDYVCIGSEEYKITRNLSELDAITEQRNDEVFAIAAVPMQDLTKFWQEVREAKRDFGPSMEVVQNFLADYT